MLKRYTAWYTVSQCHLQNKSVGATARNVYVSPRSVERRVKSFDATGNASPKDSRHKFYCKLSKFEELTVLHTLLTSPDIFACTHTNIDAHTWTNMDAHTWTNMDAHT